LRTSVTDAPLPESDTPSEAPAVAAGPAAPAPEEDRGLGERADLAPPPSTEPTVKAHAAPAPEAGAEAPFFAEPPVAEVPALTIERENGAARGCTAAQLRRFIKSRPYVPMHELRRRFELNGASDEVTPIDTVEGTVYVGLPARESRFIADLVAQGDVGLELCRDPWVPIVVGVYAMRPISRQ
jgi:hypothetical protein